MPKKVGLSSTKKKIRQTDLSFIKKLRERLGFAPAQFAEIIDVDRSTYAKKEVGKIPLSLQEWIYLIATLQKDHKLTMDLSATPHILPGTLPIGFNPEALESFPILKKIISEANEAAKNNDAKLLIKILAKFIKKLYFIMKKM